MQQEGKLIGFGAVSTQDGVIHNLQGFGEYHLKPEVTGI